MLRQYRQLEALSALKQLLPTDYPLPPTRDWAGSPDFLLVVARHALACKPENIVECSSGSSTIVLAKCVQMNGKGHVFSLENDPGYAEQTRQLLHLHGLSSCATVIDAPLTAIEIDGKSHQWYSINELSVPVIDLLIVDGPPAQEDPISRYPAIPVLIARFSKGAAVFLDDANRPGEQEIVRRWGVNNPSLKFEKIDCEKGLIKIVV